MAAFQYATLDDIKSTYLQALSTASSTDVQVLNNILDAVTIGIENYTGRRFYTTTGDEVRTLDVEYGGRVLNLDFDIASLTTVELAANTEAGSSGTYTTISTADYFLRPVQGTAARPNGWPAWQIRFAASHTGTYSNSSQQYMWPQPGENTVRLTGKFGWNTTSINSTAFPQDIRHAAAEWAIGIWRARNAGFGQQEVGIEGLGTVSITRSMPSSVRMVLDAYRVAR